MGLSKTKIKNLCHLYLFNNLLLNINKSDKKQNMHFKILFHNKKMSSLNC